MLTIQETIEYIKEKHQGQFRKDGVTPFHEHHIAVWKMYQKHFGRNDTASDIS